MNKTKVTKKMVVFGLGSNLGNRYAFLLRALWRMEEELKAQCTLANIYETPPWGNEKQPRFLNTAVVSTTDLSPQECLRIALAIEGEFNRERNVHWGPRTLDIDLLFYGDETIATEDLTVPHPFIADRSFVLTPLMDLIPDFEHPVLHQTVAQLYKNTDHNCTVFAKFEP